MLTVDDAEPAPAMSPSPTAEQPPFRDIPWRWSDVWIGIAPLALQRAAVAAIKPAQLTAVPSWLVLALSFVPVAWMAMFPLWASRRRRGPLANRPRVRLWPVAIEGLIALAIFPIMIALVSVTVLGLMYVSGRSAPPQSPFQFVAESGNRLVLLLFAGLAIAVAPVVEETFFRGFLYNALRRRLGRVIALGLQAAAFGLAHPFGVIHSVAIAVMALCLALVYEWRKTLLTPMFLHALQNTAAMAALAVSAAAYASSPVLGVNGDSNGGGCRIKVVAPGSAAARAGMQVGDVITKVDGQAVSDIATLAGIVRQKHVGDRVVVEYLRGGVHHEVEATLKKRSESPLP